jgi:hypothetical protein
MAYPTTAVTFPQNGPGENRTDAANLLGDEITAIETFTLHSASQTNAKMRLRGAGNQVEWGPAAAGRFSSLGATNGKSFVGLGCVAAPNAGQFRTGAQPGIVLTTDNVGGLLVQSVPLIGTTNQPPVTRLTIPNNGIVSLANPVAGSWTNFGLSVASSTTTYTDVILPSAQNDPWGFYSGDAVGTFIIPAGLGGTYLVVAAVTWPGNVNGSRMCKLVHLNTGYLYPDWKATDDSGGSFNQLVVMVRTLAAGESFRLQAMQNSGVALSITSILRLVRLT